MTDTPPLLDDEHAAFIASGGISVNAVSAGSEGFGNFSRCVGCRVGPARDRITLLLAATPAADFLSDIAHNGRIAAVFSKPSTHRTLQLKGTDAQREALAPDDLALVRRFCTSFAAELVTIGVSAPAALALLDAPDHDLVAVSFTPCAAFQQTPGPEAGQPLRAHP
ncbi:MAG TPA: hypothetical protein VFY31_00395 [Macromonas sp.]|nr:hypothetical protein [Macromonas sp.]